MTSMNDQKNRELFSSRPERVQPCSLCGGRGHVAQPYWLIPAGWQVEGAPEGAVHAAVGGTAFIQEATREARELARRAERPVAFEFLGKLVVVHPDDDPDLVARAWWIEFYGKTPEESALER